MVLAKKNPDQDRRGIYSTTSEDADVISHLISSKPPVYTDKMGQDPMIWISWNLYNHLTTSIK